VGTKSIFSWRKKYTSIQQPPKDKGPKNNIISWRPDRKVPFWHLTVPLHGFHKIATAYNLLLAIARSQIVIHFSAKIFRLKNFAT
jgi:hypothetical protein